MQSSPPHWETADRSFIERFQDWENLRSHITRRHDLADIVAWLSAQ